MSSNYSQRRNSFMVRYTTSDGHSATITLTDQPLIVGSSITADLRIESTFISRRHLALSIQNNRVYVTDLGSRNGTYLNGYRLTANQPTEPAN